jgi:hypothetical protein
LVIQVIAVPGSGYQALVSLMTFVLPQPVDAPYQQFENQQIPLGSGMVESACKWLIQQRFKGVGMRWSEPGFNHLLALRVAWANQRFDALFPSVPRPIQTHSPKS